MTSGKTKTKHKASSSNSKSGVKKLEAILEAIAAPMFVVDENLLITRINDAACSASGYSREEVVGKMTCAELSRTPLCGTENCTLRNCMRTGEDILGETEMTTKDGRVVPISAACSPIFDSDGNPVGGIEVIIDRTEVVRLAWETENVLTSVGAPMFVTDENLLITTINDPALKATGYSRDEVVGKMTCADLAKTPLCGTENCTIKNCMRTGKVIRGETVMETRSGQKVPIAAVCSALFDKEGKAYGGMEVILDQTEQKGTLDEVARLIEAAIKGQLDERAEIGDATGDYKLLREGINEMLEAIAAPVKEVGKVLQAAAGKNLTEQVEGDYQGQMADLKDNTNAAIGNLDQALQQVSMATEQVSSASSQIATGSQSLSSGTAEQASSIEEISSSLEEMTAMTKQSADNANEARTLSQNARDSADRGSEAMGRMLTAIEKIKASSDETAKIIKTIDEIAFQTNLLALNAAVEAARAGEAGKGFAVVAEEVRNLAQRSAEAAKNTASMIEESVGNAENGVSVSEEVSTILVEIVEGAGKANDLIGEIAASSEEQAKGIDQVNVAVAQMNEITQQNAANSEESASAAEELNSQAEELARLCSTFELSADSGSRGSDLIDGMSQSDVKRLLDSLQSKARSGGILVAAGSGNGKPAPAVVRKPEKVIPLGDGEHAEEEVLSGF